MNTDLHVLAEWLRGRLFEVDLAPHDSTKVSTAVQQVRRAIGCHPMSLWHLKVRGREGQISVIRGNSTGGEYEIYELAGDLFDGPLRFSNFKDVSDAIWNYITPVIIC